MKTVLSKILWQNSKCDTLGDQLHFIGPNLRRTLVKAKPLLGLLYNQLIMLNGDDVNFEPD